MKSFIHLIILGLLINSGTLAAQSREKSKTQEIQIQVDNNQDKSYHVKVVTEEDGTSKVFEKTYGSLEEMKSDSTLSIQVSGDQDSTFNIKVEKLPEDLEWIEALESADHQMIKTEEGNFIFFNKNNGEPIVNYFSDADSGKTSQTYEIRIRKEGESPERMEEIKKNIFVLKDEEGNISTPLGDEENEIILRKNGKTKIKKIEVRKSSIKKANILDLSSSDEDFSDFNITGIPALSLKRMNYYPNPNEGEFTLTFSGPKKPVIVRILDQKGNLMFEEQLNDFKGYYNQVINVKTYPRGHYLMQVYQQGKVLNKKLILQ